MKKHRRKGHTLRQRYGRAVHPLMPDMSWLHEGPSARNADLHERAAAALGWPVADARSMSLASLREAVRYVNPGLANEMSMQIESGAYILGGRRHKSYKR